MPKYLSGERKSMCDVNKGHLSSISDTFFKDRDLFFFVGDNFCYISSNFHPLSPFILPNDWITAMMPGVISFSVAASRYSADAESREKRTVEFAALGMTGGAEASGLAGKHKKSFRPAIRTSIHSKTADLAPKNSDFPG